MALENSSGTGVFNLTSNSSVPLKEIVQLLKKYSGATVDPNFGALPYRPNQSMRMEGGQREISTATFGLRSAYQPEEGLRRLVGENSQMSEFDSKEFARQIRTTRVCRKVVSRALSASHLGRGDVYGGPAMPSFMARCCMFVMAGPTGLIEIVSFSAKAIVALLSTRRWH